MQTWSRGSTVFSDQKNRIGKACDLSEFDHGMIVVARQGGLSSSETVDLLGFAHTTVSRVCKEKHAGSSISVGRNVLLMREVRGQGPEWLKQEGDSNANNHTLQRWYAEHSILNKQRVKHLSG